MSKFKNKSINKLNNKIKKQAKNKAFTMAEAILVMTILGIIATIMITTIKPAEFKQKALKVLAKKVFSEIDSTMTQITINNTKTGEMDKLFLNKDSNHFSFSEDLSKTEQLFKKYLATTRKEYSASDKLGTFKTIVTNSPTSASQSPPFYLKDGALVFLGTGEKYGVSLGTTGTIDVEGCIMPKSLLGIISVDINGEDEPNVAYQDQFHFPIGLNGVEYEYMCTNLDANSNLAQNPTPEPTPEPTPDLTPEPEEPVNPMQHIDDYLKYEKQLEELLIEKFANEYGYHPVVGEVPVNAAIELSRSSCIHLDDGSFDPSCEPSIDDKPIDKDGNYLYEINLDVHHSEGIETMSLYAQVINGEIKIITMDEYKELAKDGKDFTLEELNYIESSGFY